MAYFTYRAKDRQGQLISGTLEAESRSSVVSRLQLMGYFPLEVAGGEAAAGERSLSGTIQQIRQSGGRVRARELTMFYRQMSDLVGAGVPLVKSLGIVKGQCSHEGLKKLLSKIDQDVQAGDTFAKALERHPKIFTKLTTAMVHAGEMGGLLEETLARIADFAEAEEELRGKIKSALAYPVIMMMAGAAAIGVLLIFVIPRIVGIFDELNQTLPLMTRILLSMSNFIGSYWYVVLGVIAASVFMVRRYRSTETGGLQIDRLLLRVPILGEVILKREIALFTRTLGSLLRNGVPILQAITISSEVLANKAIRHDVEQVPEGITQGGGMAVTLRQSPFFPPVVTNMIAIGEETGNLPGVMLKVAATYEAQVDRSVKTLTSIIEPIIILVMGLFVGFVVIAMLLPIFELDPTAG
jgi:type II secretion system protein F